MAYLPAAGHLPRAVWLASMDLGMPQLLSLCRLLSLLSPKYATSSMRALRNVSCNKLKQPASQFLHHNHMISFQISDRCQQLRLPHAAHTHSNISGYPAALLPRGHVHDGFRLGRRAAKMRLSWS
jgi:hypothetical protein